MPRSPVQKLAPYVRLSTNADFIEIPYTVTLSPGAASFVVALWYRPTEQVIREAISHVILETASTNYTNGLLFNAIGGALNVYLQSGGPNICTTGVLAIGVWHRIVVVFDAVAGSAKTYINGVLIQTVASGLTWNIVATDVIRLGRSGDIGVSAYGDYADLVFCKAGQPGFALPVLSDVQADFARTAQFAGQSAHYPLNEGTGTSVATKVGAGSAGALNGGAAWRLSDRNAARLSENLLIRSEELDNAGAWSVTGATVSPNAIANPISGLVDADAILDTAVNTTHDIQSGGAGVAAVGQTWCASIYAKLANAAKAPVILLGLSGAFGGGGAYFNLVTGTKQEVLGPSQYSTIEDVGNGWFRLSIFGVANVAGTNQMYVIACPSLGVSSYLGDGLAAMYLWGAQITTSAQPVPYIKTAGVAVGAGAVRGRIAQSENMLAQSSLLSDAVWLKGGSSVVAAAAANPVDGALDAWGLVEDGTNAAHYVAQAETVVPLAAFAGGIYVTHSVYAKASGRTFLILGVAGGGQAQWFNLATGVPGSGSAPAGSAATMTDVGGGWYLCRLTVPILDNGSQYSFLCYASNGDGVATYVGTNALQALLLYQPMATHGTRLPRSRKKTTGVGTSEPLRNAVNSPHNLVIRSEELENGYWNLSGITVTPNALANPLDGALTADLVAETAAAGAVHTNSATSVAQTNPGGGTLCTLSAYMKNNTRRWAGLRSGVSIGHEATFDLSNGSISNQLGLVSASCTPVPGAAGWYRCSITFIFESGGAPAVQAPFLSNTGGAYTAYNGDITKSVYIWGVQLTNTPAPVAYVKATAVPVYVPNGARALIQ